MRSSSHPQMRLLLCLLVISAAGLGLLLSLKAAAHAASPHIWLSDKVGPPTESIQVHGLGFGTSESVTLAFDLTQVGTATTDMTGAFSTRISVPKTAFPGMHMVQAISQTGGAQTAFLVRTDWAQFHFGPNHTGNNVYENVLTPSNVSHLQVFWTTTLDSLVYTSPAVSNGIVYAGTFPGANFYALNASTGATVWTQHTSGSIVASPAAAAGLAYVGTRANGAFYAFNAQTGATQYVLRTGGNFFDHDATTIAHGVIYQPEACNPNGGGKLLAINATTGAILWTVPNICYDSSPAVANGRLYIGSDDGKLYVYNATDGVLLWTASTGGPISSSPAVVNGLVFVDSQDGHLYAFQASGCGIPSCSPAWSGMIANAQNNTYVSSPAVANGIVYVGSATQDKLYAFKASGCGASTCSPLWTASTTGIILASPSVANGVVYVGAWDGIIYAFDAATGKNLWSYNMHAGEIESTPAIVNGVVYIGATFASTLYAFHLPGMLP